MNILRYFFLNLLYTQTAKYTIPENFPVTSTGRKESSNRKLKQKLEKKPEEDNA